MRKAPFGSSNGAPPPVRKRRPYVALNDSTPIVNDGTRAPLSSTTTPSIAPPGFKRSESARPSTTGARSLGASSSCWARASQPIALGGSSNAPPASLITRDSLDCPSHATTSARAPLPASSRTCPFTGDAATSFTRTTSSAPSSRGASGTRAVL